MDDLAASTRACAPCAWLTLLRHQLRHVQQMPKDRLVGFGGLAEARQACALLGNDDQVGRGLRPAHTKRGRESHMLSVNHITISMLRPLTLNNTCSVQRAASALIIAPDVAERKGLVVLVNDSGRNLLLDDLIEDGWRLRILGETAATWVQSSSKTACGSHLNLRRGCMGTHCAAALAASSSWDAIVRTPKRCGCAPTSQSPAGPLTKDACRVHARAAVRTPHSRLSIELSIYTDVGEGCPRS